MGPGLLYERFGHKNIHQEGNAPHLVRGNETRTFSSLPQLFQKLVNKAVVSSNALTGSPNHQLDACADSARLYQNSVFVMGSKKFYDETLSMAASS